MKKTKLLLVVLYIISGAHFGQSQLIVDEGFESGCSNLWHSFILGCHEDWINLSGTTDSEIQNEPVYEGNRNASLWVRNTPSCVDNPDRGEGIAYTYNFRKDCTYSISFAIARVNVQSVEWILANGLENSIIPVGNSCSPQTIVPPIPASAQILEGAVPTDYEDSEWIYVEDVLFTPSENYSHLWFRISNVGIDNALIGRCFLDAVKIEQSGGGCPPVIDFDLPEYVCYGNPILLENYSQNYNAYRVEVCRLNEFGICMANTTVSSGDWTSGTFNTIDLQSDYQVWSNGQKMWCGLNDIGRRLYKVSLFIKNDSGVEVREKEVTISCYPVVDIEIPELVCEGNPVPVIDNSLYYTEYKFNICRVGPDNECLSPGGNYISSGWIDGPIGDLDLAEAYNQWSIEAGHNWRLWCNSPIGPDARYRVSIALRDECNRTTWQRKYFTVECEPCDQFCHFEIIQFPCTEFGEENANENAEEEAVCRSCYRIVGNGVIEPPCNIWQISTDINPNFQTIDFHESQIYIDYTGNLVGATYYTLKVIQCSQPGCEDNFQVETFFELCGIFGEHEDEERPIVPRLSSPEFEFSVQPNPFSEFFEVEFSGAKDNPVQISLLDINGNLVLNTIDLNTDNTGNSIFELQTQHLPSGVYFLNLKSGTFNETRKLIKIQ